MRLLQQQHPLIDDRIDTRDAGCAVRQQEHRRRGQLLRGADAAHGDVFADIGAFSGVSRQACIGVRVGPGKMALERVFCPASCIASDRDSAQGVGPLRSRRLSHQRQHPEIADRRPARLHIAVEHSDGQTGSGGMTGMGEAHDARADDGDIVHGHLRQHAPTLRSGQQHPRAEHMHQPGDDIGVEDHHPHRRRRGDIPRIIHVQNRDGGQRRIR